MLTTLLSSNNSEAEESSYDESDGGVTYPEAGESNNPEAEQSSDSESEESSESDSQEELSLEQQLDKANKKLEQLTEKKNLIQEEYDHHNKEHAEAQDDSDVETEMHELGFLEKLTPRLYKLDEKIEKAEEHVQELLELINSLL